MSQFAELYIDQGTDFSTTINMNDDNTNLPQVLTGYQVNCQLRRSVLSANSTPLSAMVSDAGNGEITISMTAANTANLRVGSYFYDITLYDTSNNTKSRLMEGVVYVTPAITK